MRQNRRNTIAALILSALCISCGGGGDNLITVVSADGKASVSVRTSGVPAGVIIVPPAPGVVAVNDPNLLAGTIYNFGPSGTVFSIPATISIKFPIANLPAPPERALVQIATVSGNSWVPIPGTITLSDGASVEVSHFTPYAVLAQGFGGLYHLASIGDGSQTVNCPGNIDFGGGKTDMCTGATSFLFGSTGNFSSGSNGAIIDSGTWSMNGDTLTVDTTARNGNPAATDTYRAVRTNVSMTLTRLTSTNSAKKIGEVYGFTY